MNSVWYLSMYLMNFNLYIFWPKIVLKNYYFIYIAKLLILIRIGTKSILFNQI